MPDMLKTRPCVKRAQAEGYQISEYANAMYNGIGALSADQKLYAISKEGTDLADDEILIPTYQFINYLGNMFSDLAEQ